MSDHNTGLNPTDRPEITDEQTGLSTRWYFDVVVEFAYRIGERGIPVTVVLLSPDQRSDSGDQDERARDQILNDFARELRAATRRTDVIAKFDEERFAGLLMDCNAQGGIVFVDRISDLMGGALSLTISAGIAAYDEDMNEPGDLTAAAHRALDAARTGGGGQSTPPQRAS